MFRVIGGAVVYGLALYGAVKLFARQRHSVIQPDGSQDDRKRRGAAADVAADTGGTSSPDQAGEASAQPASMGSA